MAKPRQSPAKDRYAFRWLPNGDWMRCSPVYLGTGTRREEVIKRGEREEARIVQAMSDLLNSIGIG